MTVAFQGEIGAFSEEAARAFFGPGLDLQPCATFRDAFAAVASGRAQRALIPIENSLFGSVHVNYDLLREIGVPIVGEVSLRIRHHLMAQPGVTLEAIATVHSHPQALGQCDGWLRAHVPHAALTPEYDTAGAAKWLAQSGRTDAAAIASAAAAQEYGLAVLAAGIEDDHQNFTRFLALAPADTAPPAPAPAADGLTPGQKTSLVFTLRANVPGALFKSLAVFALRELDLYKIESRPLVGHPGAYLFYLDVEGHRADEPVQRALDHLADFAADVQVLGTYPVGPRIGG